MPPKNSAATASPLAALTFAERLNFLLTNRVPRHALTVLIGKVSKIENPFVRFLSIGLWRLFADDLRLFEAEKTRFDSLHDCFIRTLKPGARPVDTDPAVLCSPCDAVIGECGNLNGLTAIQAKGFPYTIAELFEEEERANRYRDGRFITLRLKSSMYHHFHAPCNGRTHHIDYVSGDTWNVNPVALRVVERLFCKNERVIIDIKGADPACDLTIVAVAAILVASIRVHGVEQPLDLAYRGPNRIVCDRRLRKGDAMGYFEHGSTILIFTQRYWQFDTSIARGKTIRMGQALMRKA